MSKLPIQPRGGPHVQFCKEYEGNCHSCPACARRFAAADRKRWAAQAKEEACLVMLRSFGVCAR